MITVNWEIVSIERVKCAPALFLAHELGVHSKTRRSEETRQENTGRNKTSMHNYN